MLHTALLLMGLGGGGNSWTGLLPLVLIFGIFYFFIIRPQSQRRKKVEEMVDNLEKGDKIITSGGMVTKVNSVDEDTVLAEIDSGVKARFQKSSITDVNPNQD